MPVLLCAGLNGECRRGVLATVPSLHTCSCAVLRRGTTCLHPTKRLAGDDRACQVQVPRVNSGSLKAAQMNPQLQPGLESPTPASCCHIKIRIQGSGGGGGGHVRLSCVDWSFPGQGPRDKLGSAHTLCAGRCGGSGSVPEEQTGLPQTPGDSPKEGWLQQEKLRLQESCPPGHIAGNGGDRNKLLPTVNPLGPRPSSTAPPGRRETSHLLATGPGFKRLCAKSLSQEVTLDLPESNSRKVPPPPPLWRPEVHIKPTSSLGVGAPWGLVSYIGSLSITPCCYLIPRTL